ncbi:MAG: hypothetical protein EOP83_32935 [Verrucomicrobiaceae bacterium]|nr:MAG: hypothetical protein EOP83_32935 [Verrucomicrobiaceae bacterium]
MTPLTLQAIGLAWVCLGLAGWVGYLLTGQFGDAFRQDGALRVAAVTLVLFGVFWPIVLFKTAEEAIHDR